MSTEDVNSEQSKPTLEDMAGELFKKLLQKQQHCFDNIMRFISNYNKDGPSRKTLTYLSNKLEILDTFWQEFESNHEVLCKSDIKDDKYFKDNIFQKTETKYQQIKFDIMSRRITVLTQTMESSTQNPPQKNRFFSEQTENTSEQTPRHQHEPVKPETSREQNKQLVRQQLQNFNAFERAISKIDLDEITEKWELEDNLNILKSKWNAIDKIHWELDFELTGEGKTEYSNDYYVYEKQYDTMKKALNEKIWSSAHYDKTTPKLELPDFFGNYNQWISFRNLYTETIHSNPLLTKSQKMQHLKTKLKGEAEKLIQHLSISAENYDSAWKIIEHRYENKRLLFSSYINTLLNIPTIQQATIYNIKKLHDTLLECLNGLHNLGLGIDTWDPLLVHLMLQKLDAATYADYIHDLENPRELPDLQEFINFLEAKFMAFEAMKQNQNSQKPTPITHQQKQTQHQRFNYKSSEPKSTNFKKSEKWSKSYIATAKNCPLCNKYHALMYCNTFLDMNAKDRNEAVAKLQLCKNCLFSHGGQQCKSSKTCKICEKSHHTALHYDLQNNSRTNSSESTPPPKSTNCVNSNEQEVLLTTVQVMVKNMEGHYITLRALLDQGSQVTLVTENAAQRLRLQRRKLNAVVSGVGAALGNCKGLITLECKSIHSDYTFETEALIMRKLINNLPNTTLTTTKWDYLQNLKLADPDFNVPGPIDILLGADIYSKIIDDGILRFDLNLPVAQHTKLGWILSGSVKTFNCLVTLNELDPITKFWETEEISTQDELTNAENFCEQHYVATTERMNTGQYVVKMPLKNDIEEKLGKTRPQAYSQFLQLERKMARQEHFAKLYKKFIEEYQLLGHMKPAVKKTNNQLEAYTPHHGVIREDSITTLLRTVFNGSMKSSTKYSLNDLMEKGPNLQKDILMLILKWRTYKYALTADIEKMFRAILLHEDQQTLQKIIWRASPSDPIQEWQLCTVTYGMKAAPFLAMRTLQQLANDEGHAYPQAEKALRNQFYMDDVITGHHSIEDAKALQNQLYCLLQKGGFTLRKWASNEPVILEELTEKQKSCEHMFNFKQDEPTKTLGLGWNTKEDNFCFNLTITPNNKTAYTKRTLLSEISKIYDPLGWIAPVTIKAKLLFQNVWSDNIQWDEAVPTKIAKEWESIRSDIINIKQIYIPRWMNVTSESQAIELHGFCDASEKAYACAVYSRTINDDGQYVITLLTAKTKVAPLKKKTTLPRLELCGALLLTKLVEKVMTALIGYQLQVNCWTDSQVVLAWLQGTNTKWDRYITNRTAQITATIPATQWRYVNTKENSADCATRGLLPSQLLDFNLWWEGPQWLKTWQENSAKQETFSTDNERVLECYVTQSQIGCEQITKQLIERCSNLTRVTRCLAWVLRCKNLLRHRVKPAEANLSLSELDDATTLLIKSVQHEYLSKDIESIKKTGTVSSKSKILNLSPYLDKNDVLRVGGRLHLSSLPEEMKHPAILPHDSRLTKLVIEHAHERTLHGGARVTLAQIRQEYWIIGGNRATKSVIRSCVRCHRFKLSKSEQIMGNLPAVRVNPSRPFTHTGVDYTGHVDVKLNRGRGVKTNKGYIAIFICMVTKAVHIELVSDLSSQAFIAALKRLCARRGTPKHLYSDNGTNFRGAAKILHDEFQQYETMTSSDFITAINELQIEWHFLAPRWPTAAGIWEAAVKSMKFHLMRVMGNQKLDFEQLTTLLAQIEACMNSRPLCPLTEDPEDLQYLTPGHFLTGSPMMSLPQENISERNLDIRNRWKIVELMHQHIWNRWSSEYLHQLQAKSKWLQPKPNLEKGDLVLVKEDNVPPGKWAMGRILDLHPGKDGYVRVATLKTQTSTFKRPVTKLSPLPKNDYKEQTADSDSDETSPNTASSSADAPPVTRSTRKRSMALSSYVTIMLLTLFTLTPTWAQPAQPITNFKLTAIDGNRPIYYDEIGELQMIHDEWTLLIYYNISTYWQGIKHITKYITALDDLCLRMEQQPCGPVSAQLKHELQQLEEYNELLLSPHLSRKKRGYINGIGNLARTLFGVLDEEFAKKYVQDIENIQTNENYLFDLIKNQTSIVEAENDIIKKNELFMNQQLQSIHEYILKTNYTLGQITHRVEMMTAMNDFNAASLTASMILYNLKRTQNMLLNTMTNLYNGHFDVHHFTPKQLVLQLHMISAKVARGLSLPVKDNNIEDNIRDIYELLYVRARITSAFLLLEVHIPLTRDDEYQVYRPIALPVNMENGRYTSVTLSSSYIAVYLKSNEYLTLEDRDLDRCIQTNAGRYVCNMIRPIISLRSNHTPCEVQVFNQQNNLNCNTKRKICVDSWIKLHKQNRWLFICCDSCQARILCEDRVSTTKLTKVGILDLDEGCMLQNADTTVFAYNHFGNKLELDLDVPKITDMELKINEILPFNFTDVKQLPTTTSMENSHRDLDAKLKQLKDNEKMPGNLSSHDIHQFSILYLLVGGLLVLGIYQIIKRCKGRKHRDAGPQLEHIEMQTRQRSCDVCPPKKIERRFSFGSV